MYNLSKNYELLYQQLLQGHDVFALVDYLFDHTDPSKGGCRDVCRIKRKAEYSIDVGVRGMSYSHIIPYHKKNGTEKDVFVAECQRMNLEWVMPGDGKTEIQLPKVQASKDGFVQCPYCKSMHRHGGNGNGIAAGPRFADCGQGEYEVVPYKN